MLEIIRNIAIFVMMLGLLIIVHEAGHWLACTRLGIAVKEFGLGLPPRLATLGRWHGTLITLNWMPVGGFVRPEGELDPSVANGLAASAAWKRLIVYFAGPLANFALAFLVFTIGFMVGWPERVDVLSVVSGSPAEQAGLQGGDQITLADGQRVRSPDSLTTLLRGHMRQPVELVVLRGGETMSMTIVPDDTWSPEQYIIGIAMQRHMVAYPLPQAMLRADDEMVYQFTVTASTVAKLFQTTPNTTEQPPRVVGIVGLKQISDRAVEASIGLEQWFPILSLIAYISTALGIANLLPFPALDGGRIAFILVELIRRRRVNPKIERWANVAGLLVLLGLMVVLVASDLINPIFGR